MAAPCFGLSLVYVGAVYFCADARRSRDESSVILRRSLAVSLVCCVAWLPVWWKQQAVEGATRLSLVRARLGLQGAGASLPSAAVAVTLCAVLYAGPLALRLLERRSAGLGTRAQCLRNLLVAPVRHTRIKACAC